MESLVGTADKNDRFAFKPGKFRQPHGHSCNGNFACIRGVSDATAGRLFGQRQESPMVCLPRSPNTSQTAITTKPPAKNGRSDIGLVTECDLVHH
jgi:hypothetical protein